MQCLYRQQCKRNRFLVVGIDTQRIDFTHRRRCHQPIEARHQRAIVSPTARDNQLIEAKVLQAPRDRVCSKRHHGRQQIHWFMLGIAMEQRVRKGQSIPLSTGGLRRLPSQIVIVEQPRQNVR